MRKQEVSNANRYKTYSHNSKRTKQERKFLKGFPKNGARWRHFLGRGTAAGKGEGLRQARRAKRRAETRSSYKEHTENALASGDEEGRDKLRKAAGRSKYPLIRRYPNGETHYSNTVVPYNEFIVIRRETR